ncbi:hypothetical protein V2I21_06150 [Campylobacter sp. CLAX-22107-21]|uniref:hypothetical protein n=1 Tax=Campylobacter devanensis TaxID=3161138 RepID=UPI002EBEFF55|nr:hypothetical protein [Campylobacter sp. CLAX-22107-21]
MGFWDSIGGSITPGAVCSAIVSSSSVPSEPDLDLDEIRRQMNAMIETQNKKMKNLSLNDKYKLDDSKEFFAKLGKDKK